MITGRLGKTTRFPVMKLLVDFNNLGYNKMEQWVDITDYVLEISGSKEKTGSEIGSIKSDIATFTVDNTKKIFNKDNQNSPFYQKIKSNLSFRLLAGFKGETLVPYASGYIESFTPSWREKKYLIKTTDYFKLFKNTPVPKDSYRSIKWEDLIEILCDEAGLPTFIVKQIPKTDYVYDFFRFKEENCFDALNKLLEAVVGYAYFEKETFIIETKLALDYQLDTTEVCTITTDDMFDFDESVENSSIRNSVRVSSNFELISPLDTIMESTSEYETVQNESIIYNGLGYFNVKAENVPLYVTLDVGIEIMNVTQGLNHLVESFDAKLGKIVFSAATITQMSEGDLLIVTYSYRKNGLMKDQTRTYTVDLGEDIDSVQSIELEVTDLATKKKTYPYVNQETTKAAVFLVSATFDEETRKFSFSLKNNCGEDVIFNKLKVKGYPIKSFTPIEVSVSDDTSILEFGKNEVSIQNNYITNVDLAEKMAQFIVDNFKDTRKKLPITIDGFPELSISDVVKVIETDSGTNHKLTVEKINYSYDVSTGWDMDLELLEVDSAPWIYESFKGKSYQSISQGKKDEDFIKFISGNLMKNGGAELYTKCENFADPLAIEGEHHVPDYWKFYRTLGNATSRVRTGGNFVLHGSNSFEITSTNSGEGYLEQVINGIKPKESYILTFSATLVDCTGKAEMEFFYDGVSTGLFELDIDIANNYTLAANSPDQAEQVVVRFYKNTGTTTEESLIFDKVKLENSTTASPYIETDTASSVQADKPYANSLTIGNNYGIEVLDSQGNPRVRLGQYEPQKYGLKIYNGAIEIVRPDGAVAMENGIIKHGFSIQSSNPPFQTQGVTKEGQWFKTITTSVFENVDRYTFFHNARYLKIIVNMYTDNGVTGYATFDLTKYNSQGVEEVVSSSIVTETRPNTQVGQGHMQTVTVDLGVPTYELRTMYWRQYGSNATDAVYGNIRYIVQEG